MLLRASTRSLRSKASVPLQWLGTHSLELYLLQFHIFLSSGATKLLTVLPHQGMNVMLTMTLYLLGASRVFILTNVLKKRFFALSPLSMVSLTTSLLGGASVGGAVAVGNLGMLAAWLVAAVLTLLLIMLGVAHSAYITHTAAVARNPKPSAADRFALRSPRKAEAMQPMIEGKPDLPSDELLATSRSHGRPYVATLLTIVATGCLLRPPLTELDANCFPSPSERLNELPQLGWRNMTFCEKAMAPGALDGQGPPEIDPLFLSAGSAEAQSELTGCMSDASENGLDFQASVKPNLAYGAEDGSRLVAAREFLEGVRNRRVWFLGDSLSKRWYVGTTSTLLRGLADPSAVTTLPNYVTTQEKIIAKENVLHHLGGLPGLRLDEFNVTFGHGYMNVYNEPTIEEISSQADVIVVTMGAHYSKGSNYTELLQPDIANMQRTVTDLRQRGIHMLVTQAIPTAVCDPTDFNASIHCVCVPVRRVTLHSRQRSIPEFREADLLPNNTLNAFAVTSGAPVVSVWDDYIGRVDAFSGAAGWNGADCQHFRYLRNLFEPFVGRLHTVLSQHVAALPSSSTPSPSESTIPPS